MTTLRLADGDYEDLAWGGTQAERFHVLARERTSGDVFLYSPDFPEPCSLGPLAWYGPHTPSNSGPYALRSPSPPRIPIFETLDDAGRGTLKFVGLDCARSSFEMPEASPRQLWRLKPPDPATLMFALRAPDRRLVFLDPWARTRADVAEAVDDVVPISVGVRLIEDGHAVVRDFDGHELARFGTGVQWIFPLGATTVLYEDERGIWLRREHDELEFAKDACAFDVLTSAPQALAYFSPCADRRLVVRTLEGEELVVAEHVTDYWSYGDLLMFTQDTDTKTRLSIARERDDYAPKLIAERALLAIDRIMYASPIDVLFTADREDGTLELWRIDTQPEPPQLELVQAGISALRGDVTTLATLDTDGTLLVRNLEGLRTRLRVEHVSDTGLGYAFGNRALGLVYMTNLDADTQLGRLELRFLDLGGHFVIADDVREYREVWWPEPGLIYATGGKHPGLHFARVQIPCEDTSDAPWACSF